MARIIRTKLTAALALAAVLQKMNNSIIQLNLEEDMDGVIQLAGELVDTSFQLQQNPGKLEQMRQRLERMERLLTEGRLVHHQTTTWERMFRVAKLEQIQSLLHEAQALLMAYRELPYTLVRQRPASGVTPVQVQPEGAQRSTSTNL